MKAFRKWWEKHRACQWKSRPIHPWTAARWETLAMLDDIEVWKAALKWVLLLNSVRIHDDVYEDIQKELGDT